MRKRTLLIVLTILAFAFAVIGTILSTFYTDEYQDFAVSRVSYGFPISWHGYQLEGGPAQSTYPHPYETYWFSLESLLLDIAFWIAISFFVSFAAIKLVDRLHKTRASKKLSVINI